MKDSIENAFLQSATLNEFRLRTERIYLLHQLYLHKGNVSAMADSICVSRANLYSLFKSRDIDLHSVIIERKTVYVPAGNAPAIAN
jgi:DNA-binding NtrC family response regulator